MLTYRQTGRKARWIVIYTEKILESIAEQECREIQNSFNKPNAYNQLSSFKNMSYGKLIMLLKLGLITLKQYTDLKEIVENCKEDKKK